MNDTTRWTVTADHPALAGHFPGTPIVPGVLLLDWVLHGVATATGIAPDRCELNSVKFLSPARPGDALVIHHSTSVSGTLRFEVVAARRKIASGSIVPISPV